MRLRYAILAVATLVALSGYRCHPQSPNAFHLIGYAVIDAAYDPVSDRLCLLSADPPALHVFYPNSGVDVSITLPPSPEVLAVSPDGTVAAVAHDQALTQIDLRNHSVVATVPISPDPFDMVITGDGYARIFPEGVRENTVSSVDLSTGVETVMPWPPSSDGRVAAVHADGLTVYAADTHFVPDDIHRYAPAGPELKVLRNSPYHGDYPFCGALWPSEDGLRLLTGCGHVLRTSPQRFEDMTYNGMLSHAAELESASHSAERSRTLVIPKAVPGVADDADREVQIYEDQQLGFLGTMTLPDFPDGTPAHGRHVFWNAPGEKFLAVVESTSSGSFGVLVRKYSETLFSGAVPPPPPDQDFLRLAGFRVVDAEYSAALDRIVAVSGAPPALHVIDPESGQTNSLPLPHAGWSVGVSPNGLGAAVAHDGYVSQVGLAPLELLNTWPVPWTVLDIAASDDGRAFVVPDPDPHDKPVWGVDLATGEYATGPFIRSISYPSAHAKLHPHHPILYVAHYYERDLWHHDVSSLAPNYRWYLPAFGTPPCSNLWLSRDGARIFTACGHVFSASLLREEDLQHQGQIATNTRIRHLDHSETADQVAFIEQDNWIIGHPDADQTLRLASASTFLETASIDLPDFVVQGDIHASRGQFAFFASSGDRLYVVVEAAPESGLLWDQGIVAYDITP